MDTSDNLTHIVVIGAGFAGIEVVKKLKDQKVKITLIDRNNYHKFTPLLYQVATAQLEIEEIVFPIRQIIGKHDNVKFLMAEVDHINQQEKYVVTDIATINYDYLIIATGTVTHYFGIDDAKEYSYPLKELSHGIKLRNHILTLIENYSSNLQSNQNKTINFVIVGGGPTGVEFSGALAELINGPILKDHPNLVRENFEIHLIDGSDRVLSSFDEKLSRYTEKKLKKLGVMLHKKKYVTDLGTDFVRLSDGSTLSSNTTIWSAGIAGSESIGTWGIPVDNKNFIQVDQYLQVINDHTIFAIGDIANIRNYKLPKIATVAQQQGEYVAKYITKTMKGEEIKPFKFKDKGKMAVIGRNYAVVELKRIKFSGFLAWISWCALHIFKLIGFRNRLNIMINWAISYFRKGGQSRVIIQVDETKREKLLIKS